MRTELLLAGALSLAACKKDEAAAPPPPAPVQARAEASVPAAPPAEAKTWNVRLDFNPPLLAGKENVATITIAALDGFHVNPDYPLSFKPVANEQAGLSGERIALTATGKTPCKDKAEDSCEVTVPLTVTPKAVGTVSVEGVLSFSVCSEEKCLTPKEPLQLRADVQ